MNLEAASGSNISKKKVSKNVFYGSAGGFFSQKKKVVLEKIKHSGDEKNIFLSKSGSGNNMYSNADNLSGNNESVNITGIKNDSLLGSAANILKAKQVNTDTVFGSPLSFSNFVMDDNEEISLLHHLPISLDKKWIDPKIIKT